MTITVPATMLALTVWEPWASAIVHGCLRTATGATERKPVENRRWPPDWRGLNTATDFAIHAARKIDRDALAMGPPVPGLQWPPEDDLIPGVVIGTGRLLGWHHPERDSREYCRPGRLCSPWALSPPMRA
jgi:hypothetical protein